MKIKAYITISKHHGNREKVVGIVLRDENSRSQFFRGEISLENLAEALLGLAAVEMDAEVSSLQYVGKYKVVESREIVCPITDYDRDVLGKWLSENAKEDGWIVSPYLGSKGQVSHHPDGQLLRYSVFKFVDEKPEESK